MVVDDVGWSVVFGDPPDEMCTIVVNMLGKFEITVLILNHLLYFQVGMDAM